jgi:hypothetical protein
MLVEGNYEQIREIILSFVDEKVIEDTRVREIVLAITFYLSLTELNEIEQSVILEDVLYICETNVEQKRIHVELYSAHDELISLISSY